ncbi:putative amidohydrolase [Robbsia andropogonis]|uniref:carbon-nitrogen hydrolase family protein n=1 Tax=Robbsia andropogonis TaxID=28092 RepID=UPI003D21BA81
MINDIRIGAAQTVDQHDFQLNVFQHCKFIEVAGCERVELLVFPELSLTGYHREQARSLAVDMLDPRLAILRDAAVSANVTAVVGCPLRVDDRIFIASIIFKSDGTMASYCKQHLHPGEDHFFCPGSNGPAYLNGVSVALAICADTSHPDHASKASARGANTYAASCLITPGGYARDSALMQDYAAKHAFTVLLANHGGPTGGFAVAGKSAIWDERGHCVSSAPGVGAQLVIGERASGHWLGRVVSLEHPLQ